MLKVLESPGILNNEKRDCKNSICSSLIIKLPFLEQVEIDVAAQYYYQF